MSKKQMREKMKDSIAVRVNEKEVKTLAQLTLEFKLLQSELNKAMDKDDPSLISLKENLRKVQRQKELAEQWEIEEIRQIRVLEAFRAVSAKQSDNAERNTCVWSFTLCVDSGICVAWNTCNQYIEVGHSHWKCCDVPEVRFGCAED